MFTEEQQSARDAAVAAALSAYDNRNRAAPYEEQFRLWEALWEACDFSWEGLRDNGHDGFFLPNFAQKLKHWDEVGGYRSLQDYWRCISGDCLDDTEMVSQGHLVERDGRLWHVLHRPESILFIDNYINPFLQDFMFLMAGMGPFSEDQLGPRPVILAGVRAQGVDRMLTVYGTGPELRAPMAAFPIWATRGLQFRSADFNHSIFGNGASFNSARFGGPVDFARALFGEGPSFRETVFSGTVGFEGVSFGGGATLERATFLEETEFKRAVFVGRTSFDGAKFVKRAGFEDARFQDEARLAGATFEGETAFTRARFSGALDADGAKFLGRTDFRGAEITGRAGFAGCTWPDRPEDYGGAFKGCRFRDVADFETDGFKAFALFDGAEFKGRVLLTDPGQEAEDELFREALRAATEPAGERDSAKADARLGALVGGLRVLKMAMAAQGDRDREQRFFRYEVQARAKRPGEGKAARLAARLYGLTSDYGASIGRPLCCFFWAWLLFAGLYGVAGLLAGTLHWALSWEGPSQALQISLANSFRPFFLLEVPREGSLGFLADLLRRSDGVSLALRLLGALQSLSTIILLFLAGVALRRKFQIS